MFNKVLIANRGEIACRIIRTARQLGIQTVAVYSAADQQAQHVQLADEAVYIGAAPSQESYLCIDKIIAAAQQTGAEAVHPGYGFLAENDQFATALAEAGLVFIGPPAAAIQAMGSKSAAKTIMQQAGVPLVPGYHGEEQSTAYLQRESDRMGYPVLLKAAYGGGGKGMRVVQHADEFAEALSSAQREAKAAFGNDKMLIEKYLQHPRHVEVQIFCDQQGNGLYLAERDCSVQRRHQKVIEEAPAPGLSTAVRQAMGEAAVRAAQAIDYVGAGTVEFLLDSNEEFYFMEMNTRLQVEHPVTEMITGIDLVAWQFQVAAGHALPLQQNDLVTKGHAFEARIYAENPDDNFMPSTGYLDHLHFPATSAYVRVDSGVVAGDEVSSFYDPMIAKLIVWDKDRSTALRRLQQALRQTHIAGLATNTDYLHRIASHPAFIAAKLSTHFIDDYQADLTPPLSAKTEQEVQLLFAAFLAQQQVQQQAQQIHLATNPYQRHLSPWQSLIGWQMNAAAQQQVHFIFAGEQVAFDIIHQTDGSYLILGQQVQLFTEPTTKEISAGQINQRRFKLTFATTSKGYSLFTEQGRFDIENAQPLTALEQQEETGSLAAPMNGTLVAVNVKVGEQVTEGQALVVMEAMKMEYTIRAPFAGEVSHIYFQAGELVSDGAELVNVQPFATDSN